MIIEATETICTLVAAGYAAHKIENMMIRRGMRSPLDDESRDSFYPKAEPQPRPATWTIEDARREAKLFIDVPGAFWLDPNRWGDDPDWRERLFPEPKPAPLYAIHDPKMLYRATVNGDTEAREIGQPAPPCPVCPDGGKRTVMNVHGGEATMWDCFVCGTEFTRAGETKSSKKARQAKLVNRRNDAWDARAYAVRHGMAENHGSCPGDCGFPVDKKNGWYRCSREDCDRHNKPWR